MMDDGNLDWGTMEALWLHGGLALAAGVLILLFPKIFFLLIGGFLVVNGGIAFFGGADPIYSLAVVLGGVLIFVSPKLVAWFVALYLLIFAIVLVMIGVGWPLAIPVLLMAGLALLAPKLLPFLVGILLVLSGGASLVTTFL